MLIISISITILIMITPAKRRYPDQASKPIRPRRKYIIYVFIVL